MKRIFAGLVVFTLASVGAPAQSLEDLNIQIHGYATQGFLYTSNNNYLTTTSSNGSPDWTEAVVNIGAQPVPKLRIAAQGRFLELGSFGSNGITLDWAAADYKADERIGVRFGKVKTPSGMFNEIQDIDPAYMWALLPQSIYPISSRNGVLAHYGGVVYGSFNLGGLGKLEYRGWAGERKISGTDGYFIDQTEAGLLLPNGQGGVLTGEALHWKTPLKGLMIGASNNQDNKWVSQLTAGPLTGTETVPAFNIPNYFGSYEKNKLMVAGEYQRIPATLLIQFNGLPPEPPERADIRSWYAMATYKLTSKLTAGVYDSQEFDMATPLGPARYSKDWAFAGRYDFNQYLYAKAEEHVIDGTAVGYDTDSNPNGLKPNTKLTVLKIGVSF